MSPPPRAAAAVLAALLLLSSCATAPEPEPDPDRSPPTEAGPPLPSVRPPFDEPVQAVVDRTLAQMSLEQLIGQRFVTWLDGTKVTPAERRLVVGGLVSGFIVYPQNIEDRRQLRDLTSTLQGFAGEATPQVGLFFAADQEGGRVAALRLPDMPQFPAFRQWARHKDPTYVEAASYVVNRELRSVGINMNFAPVLDVYDSADDSIIGDRALSGDPAAVSRLGRAYLSGAERAGVIAVPKHFPGHGSTSVDSHGTLPNVPISETELYRRHVRPFREAVDAGAEAVMTAHLLLPALDAEHPVTLSEPAIKGLLRSELSFSGVVISDGVAMGAISQNYSMPEAIDLSFEAGIDIILVHTRYDVAELVQTTLDLLEAGRITREEVLQGARRVLELKARHGLVSRSPETR